LKIVKQISIKRSSKYLVIITASFIVVLVFAVWILAAALQNKIRHEITGYLQKYPGTELSYDQFRISFLKSFPKVHLEITGIVCSDQDHEALKAGKLTVIFNLKKIIHDSIDIQQVVIRDASLNLFSDVHGSLTQLFSSLKSNPQDSGNSLSFSPGEILVYNFLFRSENRTKKNMIRFEVTEGSFLVGINKPLTRLTAKFKGRLDSLTSRGTSILSNLAACSDKLVLVNDNERNVLALEQGNIMAENLELTPSFSLSKQEDGRLIDWSIRCDNDLNDFLSILNMKAGKDLKQTNPDAKATLVFRQKGIISNNQNPYTELDFAITDAKIKSNKMPYPVTDLFISGNYNNGEKHSSQSASIRIDTLHARIGDSFIEGKANVNNLKDPQISAKLTANFDLQDIIKPTDLFSASGTVRANLEINGRLNAVEKEGITGKDLASGVITMQNLDFYLQDSSYRIQIADGKLTLENQSIKINRFNGLLNKETFFIEGQLSHFDGLILKQKIEGNITAGFNRIDLTGFKPGEGSDTTSGRFLEFLFGHLSLAVNTSIGKFISPFGEMDNIDIQAKWEQAKLSVNDLNLDFRGMKVKGDGQLSFKNNRLDSVRANADIVGKILDLEDIQDITEAIGSRDEKSKNGHPPDLNLSAHIALDTLLAGEASFYNISGHVFNSRKPDVKFDISAQKVVYEDIMADSIAFSGISSGAITEINHCDFSYAGGKLSLEGILRSNKDQTYTGNIISGASGIDMKQILGSFGNFGQAFLTGDNISGNVSWTADLYFLLDSNFKLVDEGNFWKFNFKITDSQFSDVVPIEKTLSFIRQKSKEDILVSNLEFSTFYVRQKLYFHDVAIKNSVSDMNIFGTYLPNDTIADIDLQLSLSDLLFKSLRKRMIETEEGPMDVGKDKNLSLKFTGTVGQHHIKPLGGREFIKQKDQMQSQLNEFDAELQKRIAELSGGD
jgi:hypothetical protein